MSEPLPNEHLEDIEDSDERQDVEEAVEEDDEDEEGLEDLYGYDGAKEIRYLRHDVEMLEKERVEACQHIYDLLTQEDSIEVREQAFQFLKSHTDLFPSPEEQHG